MYSHGRQLRKDEHFDPMEVLERIGDDVLSAVLTDAAGELTTFCSQLADVVVDRELM